MTHSPDDARRLLCALGDHVRDVVVGARGIDMAAIEGETAADTIYAIDRVADDTLLDWFEEHWPDVEVVSEGSTSRWWSAPTRRGRSSSTPSTAPAA